MQGIDLSTPVRQNAVNKFKFLRERKDGIFCPYLGCNVKFTTEGFRHIIYRSKKNIRIPQEIDMRCLCFLNVDKILKKSGTCQEYRSDITNVLIKKNGKKIKEKRLVEYFGFVAIVDTTNGKYRIRVVIKKIFGYSYAEYLSIMPAWQMKGHQNFMGELV